ncbi:hypothetical protein [Glaciecola sp. SC05]|uniref:hypothetical protein n=1 Tax=Glaciecola sp. SC05 TaxID=1987355 RepID=UPI0035287B2C
MRSIAKDVAKLNFIVALLSVLLFIYLMPTDLLGATVIFGAFLPYVILSYFLGLRFGFWYLADGERPGLFEFLSVPIVLVLFNTIASSFVYGTFGFLNALFFEDRFFTLSPSISGYFEFLVSGIYSGFIFVAVTSLVQVSLLLLGSAFFIAKVRRGAYAL